MKEILKTLATCDGTMPQTSLMVVTAQDLKEFAYAIFDRIEREKEKAAEASKELPTLTRDDVAKMLHVNLTTLWRWEKSGYLCPVKVGGRTLYRKTDVEQAMNNRTDNTTTKQIRI